MKLSGPAPATSTLKIGGGTSKYPRTITFKGPRSKSSGGKRTARTKLK